MRRSLALICILLAAGPVGAAEWDYDTLQIERERFPGALELIVGKFLRHSDAFYDWRIEDRRADLAAHESGERSLSDEKLARRYDDLAAALVKRKRHDEAIAVIREKAERLPEVGRYETHANLGTFLIHSGRLEEGVAELKKAIEINPEAHFGREKYQVLLVEYVIEKRGAASTIPIPLDRQERSGYRGPFAEWILARQQLSDADETEISAEIKRATHGVLGMMRFGDYRSPVLLEALGDLLKSEGDNALSHRLAARAFLKAGEEAEDADAKAAYREMARWSIMFQYPDKKSGELMATDATDQDGVGLSLTSLEDQLRREVREADEWFETTIAHDEAMWVEVSPDPDARFWEKYGGQEIRVGHDRLPAGKFAERGLPWGLRAAMVGALVVTIAIVLGALWWRRQRPTGYISEGVNRQ